METLLWMEMPEAGRAGGAGLAERAGAAYLSRQLQEGSQGALAQGEKKEWPLAFLKAAELINTLGEEARMCGRSQPELRRRLSGTLDLEMAHCAWVSGLV